MGLTDVEANYAVVKAYQFTTLTSIQVPVHHSDQQGSFIAVGFIITIRMLLWTLLIKRLLNE